MRKRNGLQFIVLSLLGLVLASWSMAAGPRILPVRSGLGQGAAIATREAPSPQSDARARGLARIVAPETHRQKPARGPDDKRFGTVREAAPWTLPARHEATPTVGGDAPWSAPFRAFEPRGPPSLIV